LNEPFEVAHRVLLLQRKRERGQLGAAPAEVCSRAAFQNSQADMSHSPPKNTVSIKISPVEPDPAISAITVTADGGPLRAIACDPRCQLIGHANAHHEAAGEGKLG